MADTVSCASCPFFDPPKPAPEGVDTSRAETSIFRVGSCRRFPHAEPKRPEDWCGEHPKLRELMADVSTFEAASDLARKDTSSIVGAIEKVVAVLAPKKTGGK